MNKLTKFKTTLNGESLYVVVIELNDNSIKLNYFDNKPIKALHVTEKEVQYHVDSTLNLKKMSNRKDYIYIINPAISININRKPIDIKKIKTLPMKDMPKQVEDFYYAYSYMNYNTGNEKLALSIISNNLKDKFLTGFIYNAFTLEEKRRVKLTLRHSVIANELRYKDGKCPPNYTPSKKNVCFLDLLNLLIKINAKYFPGLTKYNRVTRKVTDNLDVSEDIDINKTVPLSNIVFNEKRLNLSVRYPVTTLVHLNEQMAKDARLSPLFQAIKYRTHTFIADGEMNISEITCLIPEEKLDLLNEAGFAAYIKTDLNTYDGKYITVNLKDMPVITPNYDIDITAKELLRLVKTLTIKKISQKVVEHYKTLHKGHNVEDSKMFDFTVKQLKVLKHHGIHNGFYYGIDNEIEGKEDSTEYITKECYMYLKGFSTIPSVKQFLKDIEGKKKLTPVQYMMNGICEYYKGITDRKTLAAEEDKIKKEILDLKAQLAKVRFSMVLNHKNIEDLEAVKDHLEYKDENDTLIVKLKYGKEYK